MLLQFAMPLPRCECLGVKVVQSSAIPNRAAANLERRAIAADGDGIRGVGLELDGVRAGFFRGVDQPDGLLQILIVVCRQLRHDVQGMAGTDTVIADLYHYCSTSAATLGVMRCASDLPAMYRAAG